MYLDTDFMHLLYMKLCGTYGQDILCLITTAFNFALEVQYPGQHVVLKNFMY